MLDLYLRVHDASDTEIAGAEEMAHDALVDATKALVSLEVELGGYSQIDERQATHWGTDTEDRPLGGKVIKFERPERGPFARGPSDV